MTIPSDLIAQRQRRVLPGTRVTRRRGKGLKDGSLASRTFIRSLPTIIAMPTREQIDAYIASVEDYVYQSYEFVTNIDAMNDSVQRLWMHVTRFGPPEMPDIRLPSLGLFEVPAPAPRLPPPPPPPTAWYEDAAHWMNRNKALTGALCASAVGAGLLVGYRVSRKAHAKSRRLHNHRTIGVNSSTRRLLVGKSHFSYAASLY